MCSDGSLSQTSPYIGRGSGEVVITIAVTTGQDKQVIVAWGWTFLESLMFLRGSFSIPCLKDVIHQSCSSWITRWL
jgi:hypothetical protein